MKLRNYEKTLLKEANDLPIYYPFVTPLVEEQKTTAIQDCREAANTLAMGIDTFYNLSHK